jgi:hypothetical protein
MVRVEAYIPKYPMDQYLAFKRAIEHSFGCTTIPYGHGAWRAQDGNIVQENVSIFIIIMEDLRLYEFEELLRTYKTDAKQEAVLYTFSHIKAVLF